jgi:hypothetical protein
MDVKISLLIQLFKGENGFMATKKNLDILWNTWEKNNIINNKGNKP